MSANVLRATCYRGLYASLYLWINRGAGVCTNVSSRIHLVHENEIRVILRVHVPRALRVSAYPYASVLLATLRRIPNRICSSGVTNTQTYTHNSRVCSREAGRSFLQGNKGKREVTSVQIAHSIPSVIRCPAKRDARARAYSRRRKIYLRPRILKR